MKSVTNASTATFGRASAAIVGGISAALDPATNEPYVELVYSDSILITLLKRHFPEYRDKPNDVHIASTVNNAVVLSEEKQKELAERHLQALEG